MVWCPHCKVEYRDNYLICGNCGTELVDNIESVPQIAPLNDQPTFFTNVADRFQADIVESLLKTEGIPVLRKHKETGDYLDLYMGISSFGIDLYVPSKLLDKANQVINNKSGLSESELENAAFEISETTDGIEKYDLRKHNRSLIIFTIFYLPALIWMLLEAIQYLVKLLHHL